MISSIEPTMAFPSVDELTSAPVSALTVKSGIVDLWSVLLQGNATVMKRCHAWLSDQERARAARFVHAEDQNRFTLAHGTLRMVLVRYLGIEPGAIRFQTGPTGKPALVDEAGGALNLRFNLSHSHGRMLLAVANGEEVGIDLEQIRSNVEALKLAERFYAPAEYERIRSVRASDHAMQFYRLWVAKEAFLKAQGTGILSLEQCEILSEPSLSRAGVRLTRDSALQEGWTIQWLACGKGWQGAVSAYGQDWSVRVLDTMSV